MNESEQDGRLVVMGRTRARVRKWWVSCLLRWATATDAETVAAFVMVSYAGWEQRQKDAELREWMAGQ